MKRNIALLISMCVSILSANAAVDLPTNIKLADKQELRLNLGANPTSIDPNLSADVLSSHVIGNLFESLTRSYGANGNIIPAAALSWSSNDDFTEWTFNLNPKATWSNGDKLTANDFVYSWQRLLDPKLAAINSSALLNMGILNAGDVITGNKSASQLGIRAVDDYTLEIKTINPIPWLPNLVSSTFLAPVPSNIVDKYGKDWIKPTNIVSNGPFILSEYIVNEKITLKKNINYWNKDKVIINDVKFFISGSSPLIQAKFFSGELDITYPSENIYNQLRERNIPVIEVPGFNSFAFQFNVNNSKLKDVKVRKAIQLAYNSKIIVKKILKIGGETASWTPNYMVDANLIEQPEFFNLDYKTNIEEARKLITEAGYSKLNPLKLEILYYSFAKKSVIAFGGQVSKSLDGAVKFTYLSKEWGSYLDSLNKGEYEIAYKVGIANYNHASDMLGVFTSNSSNNNSGYNNKEYDRLFQLAKVTKDDLARKKIYKELDYIISKDAVVVPSNLGVLNYIMNSKLRGSKPSIFGIYAEDFYFIE